MAKSKWALWDVYLSSAPLHEETIAYRQRLFEAADRGDWPAVLASLDLESEKRPWASTVNLVRPDDISCHSLLHLAVLADAQAQVILELLSRGHFLSTRCAQDKRPIDLARELGRERLLSCLEPVLGQSPPAATLSELQSRFHRLVLETALTGQHKTAVRLPGLEILLEREDRTVTFLVPMMTISCQLQQVCFPCPQPLDASHVHREWLLLARFYDRMGGGCDSYYTISRQGALLVDREVYD